MKIYIAGPMTGYEELNYPEFHRVAQVLRNAGNEVVSPAELNPIETGYEDAMRNDIRALIGCDAIYMMSGWSKSKGAMLEFQIALRLNLTVLGDGRF